MQALDSPSIERKPVLYNPCRFCRLTSTDAGHPRAQYDRPLWTDYSHMVVPTKGALLTPWLLVIPRRHSTSSLELTEIQRAQLLSHVNRAVELVSGRCRFVTVFENCPLCAGTTAGCGIDHTHIHVVGSSFSIIEALRTTCFLELDEYQSPLDLKRWMFAHQGSAAWLEEVGRERVWLPLPPGSRQFVRQKIASVVGLPHSWDYDLHPFPLPVDAVSRPNSQLGDAAAC